MVSLTDIVAYGFGGIIFELVTFKIGLMINFGLSGVSGLLILFVGMENQSYWYFYVIVVGARLGVTAAYQQMVSGLSSLFYADFLASAFGIGVFFATIFTIMSPLLANMASPWPIVIFTLVCAVNVITVFFLKTKTRLKDIDELNENVDFMEVTASHSEVSPTKREITKEDLD